MKRAARYKSMILRSSALLLVCGVAFCATHHVNAATAKKVTTKHHKVVKTWLEVLHPDIALVKQYRKALKSTLGLCIHGQQMTANSIQNEYLLDLEGELPTEITKQFIPHAKLSQYCPSIPPTSPQCTCCNLEVQTGVECSNVAPSNDGPEYMDYRHNVELKTSPHMKEPSPIFVAAITVPTQIFVDSAPPGEREKYVVAALCALSKIRIRANKEQKLHPNDTDAQIEQRLNDNFDDKN